MAQLDKMAAGLVANYTFSSQTSLADWVLSPEDGGLFDLLARDGWLRIFPSATATLALRPCPDEQYAVEAEIEFAPQAETDLGGLVLWNTADDNIRLAVTQEGSPYCYLRLKVADGWCYATGSADGVTWEFAGAVAPGAGAFPGLFVEGDVHLDVARLSIVRDTAITVANLPPQAAVLLYDAGGNLLSSATAVDTEATATVKLSSCPLVLNGYLQVRDANGDLLVQTEIMELAGGDVFWFSALDISVQLGDQVLTPGQEVDLGGFVAGVIEKRLLITNNSSLPTGNVAVKGLLYSDYLGWQWVSFAPEISGVPGEYAAELALGTIGPGESAAVWLKVERQEVYPCTAHIRHKFLLLITEGGG
jgi:hypothetical protein